MHFTLGVCLLISLPAFADEPKNLLKPTNQVESWRFEQHEGGEGTIKAEDEAIVFDVTKVTGTDWHVQAVQEDLDLKEGQEYTLTFQAKCDSTGLVGLNAMIDQEDWHQLGLAEQVTLGSEFKDYKYTFRAEGVVPQKNRITIVLGLETGTVSIKNLVLAEASP